MYCPSCATQNGTDARFCRVCGLTLEVVSLALDGQLVPKNEHTPKKERGKSKSRQSAAELLMLKRAKAIREIISGSMMIAVSLLILLGPMPFIRQKAFAWLVIWSAIFGWMAIWGTTSFAQGLGQVLASDKLMTPENSKMGASSSVITSELPDGSENSQTFASLPAAYDVGAPPSVTETTTRHLNAQSE